MIWIKRVLPFVVIVIVWQAYAFYTEKQQAGQDETDRIMALLTAKIWVASAKYRDEPDKFITYRDSVLAAEGVTAQEMFALTKRVNDDPEQLMPFTRWMSEYVDSLTRIEDSLSKLDTVESD